MFYCFCFLVRSCSATSAFLPFWCVSLCVMPRSSGGYISCSLVSFCLYYSSLLDSFWSNTRYWFRAYRLVCVVLVHLFHTRYVGILLACRDTFAMIPAFSIQYSTVMFCRICGFRVRVWESSRTFRSFGYGYGCVTELTEVPGIVAWAHRTHTSSVRV